MALGLPMANDVGSRSLVETFVEAFPDAILLMEQASPPRIALANVAAGHLLGRTREQLVGLSLAEMSPPEQQSQIPIVLDILRQRGQWRGTWSLLDAGSSPVPTEASFALIECAGERLLLAVLRLAKPTAATRQLIGGSNGDEVTDQASIELSRLGELRTGQLVAIREVAAELTRELELKQLLELITDRVMTLLWPTAGILRIWDEASQRLVPMATRRFPPHTQLEPVPMGEGVTGIAGRELRLVVVNDYPTWSQAVPGRRGPNGITAAVAAPMVFQSRLVGVITVARFDGDPPFDQAELDILKLFADQAAIAIENARLYKREQDRRDQLRAVHDVAAELTRELHLPTLLKLIWRRAAALINADRGALFLWEENESELRPYAWPEGRDWSRGSRLKPGEGVSGQVAERLEGMILNDYAGSARSSTPRGIRPFVAEPIMVQDRFAGVLTLGRSTPDRPFSERDLETLRLFARHAAVAIENARLYSQGEVQRRQLDAIRELTSDIVRELDLPTVLNLTVGRAATLVRGQTGVIYVWDEVTQLLQPRAIVQLDSIASWPPIRLGEGLTGIAASQLAGIIENDYVSCPHRREYAVRRSRSRAVIAAPIVYKGQLVGVITIGRTAEDDPFVKEDLDSLCLFADHMAIAIEHARLYEELSRHADQMQELVTKMYRAQDEERRRVAYDVHDGLAQTAAAAHHHLEALATMIRPRSDAARRQLGEARALTQQTVREARRLIAGLRPTVLDDLGLASAVRVEVDGLRADGRTVEYRENLGSRRLPLDVETALFSVAHEALTNVRKHAGPTAVEIDLTLSDVAVGLKVRDAGSGFDLARLESHGTEGERIGLRGMKERVEWLGGQVEITSRRGRGTCVSATVPITSRQPHG